MNGRLVILVLSACLLTTAAVAQITVVSSSPVNGAVSVLLQGTISLTFSEPLDTNRHMGDEGTCIYFLSRDPEDSMQVSRIYFSEDLRTISADLMQTANTDFVWLVTAAFGQNGDTLSVPFGLCYTTSDANGPRSVSGHITYNGNYPPTGDVIGLMDGSPFGQGHATLKAGTIMLAQDGSYSIPNVRAGTYWPIAARDMNHDGNMDGETDLLGFYDPNHTGQPQSITVADADLSGVNLDLGRFNDYVTARALIDTATFTIAQYGSDFHLVMIQSSTDSITLDGRSRSWRYGFYSPSRQRGMTVQIDGRNIEIDSTLQNNQYPPNVHTLPQEFLDSDSVLAIAEAHGGREIRTQHNVVQRWAYAGGLQWFMPQDTSTMVWAVMYNWRVDTTWQNWVLLLDLQTGRLIDLGVTEHSTRGNAEQFALLPNYPNPFNPVTVIPFVVSKGCLVDLRVYDMLGQEVATLAHGEMAAGVHSVQFDGRALPTGIYFYRLKAGDFVSTRKMMLVK